MIIQYISVSNFGSVRRYSAFLNPDLNILDSHFSAEISMAIELVLCSEANPKRLAFALRDDTLIKAEILLDESNYYIQLKPSGRGWLRLSASDGKGNDVTDSYRALISHCAEEDAVDSFDGQKDSFSLRLCWYRGCDDCESLEDLFGSFDYFMGTKTFRSNLVRYIKAFEPEPINNNKNYMAAINNQGKFEVIYPDPSEVEPLSETEKKLFWYICFLNIAEFWADIESMRNIHHEKKPLLVKNFLEFLDQTTDLDGLIARTAGLGRQVVILTLPMEKTLKKKWMEKK